MFRNSASHNDTDSANLEILDAVTCIVHMHTKDPKGAMGELQMESGPRSSHSTYFADFA